MWAITSVEYDISFVSGYFIFPEFMLVVIKNKSSTTLENTPGEI